LSIVAGPIVMLVTERAKNKRNMDGHVAIAIVCLLVGFIYSLATLLLPEATINQGITLAANTGFWAMTAYNFIKAAVNKEK